jgi:serine/threonine protein kinase
VKYCDSCHSAYPDDFAICPRDQGPLRVASELLPRMVIRSKYEILEKIGSGGMASVYRARHLAFGEVCAIKVVAGKLAHDDTFLRRFRNEAIVTRRLQHPNAVRVDDLDTTEDGRPFIVMEFVEGRNLRDVIRQEAPLHPRRAVAITRQVASALAAAHALGIVHRDIKPDNILLTHDATGHDLAKVLDFGIAKVKETVLGEDAYTPTRTGMVVGTPQYVSPEQAMGKRGEEIDGRSDLYSLGVVLYEMLTGRLPFSSDTAMGMILHHLQTAPTPPNVARPDLGIADPLSDLLMMALQKDPTHRFPGAHDMAAALDEVVDLLPPLAAPTMTGADAVPLHTPTPPNTSRTPPVPAPPRTPTPRTPLPSLPLPTPPGAQPTRVEDIAERPTRMFPGTPPPTSTFGAPTLTTPAPGYPRPPMPPLPPPGSANIGPSPWWLKKVLIWTAVGLFIAAVFSSRNHQRDRREAERQRAAETAPSPEVAGSPDDGDVQDGIERLLGNAKATKEENIDVEVDEGVVTLSGSVGDPAAAQVAEALAESYPGVKGVRNQLELPQHAEGGGRTLNIPIPKMPPIIVGRPGAAGPAPGTPQYEALTELLKEGKKAIARGEAEEALAIYGSALAIDGRNLEAHRGMQEAANLMRTQMHKRWGVPGQPVEPVAPVPPAPRVKPVPPPPSPDGDRGPGHPDGQR